MMYCTLWLDCKWPNSHSERVWLITWHCKYCNIRAFAINRKLIHLFFVNRLIAAALLVPRDPFNSMNAKRECYALLVINKSVFDVRIRHGTLTWPNFCLFSQIQDVRSLRSVQLISHSSRAGVRSPSIDNIPPTLRKHPFTRSRVWSSASLRLWKKFCIFLLPWRKVRFQANWFWHSGQLCLNHERQQVRKQHYREIKQPGEMFLDKSKRSSHVSTTEVTSKRLFQWGTEPPIRTGVHSVCKTKPQLGLPTKWKRQSWRR